MELMAAPLTLVPWPLQSHQPEGSGSGWGWGVMLWVGLGRRVKGEGLQCTVHAWCLPYHSRHLMLLSPAALFYIFYKCAKLRGLGQKSSVTANSINRVGSVVASELC